MLRLIETTNGLSQFVKTVPKLPCFGTNQWQSNKVALHDVALYRRITLPGVRSMAEQAPEQHGGENPMPQTILHPQHARGRSSLKGQHYLSFFFLSFLHNQANEL